jgi:hypothetical protein
MTKGASMKRALVFLIVGPLAVALVASLELVAAGGRGEIVQFIAMALFLLTLPVAALAGAIDGGLARTFPIVLRAPLTAIVGATAACILAFALLHCFFPPSELAFFSVGGAICMGACSLLANDYSRAQYESAVSG